MSLQAREVYARASRGDFGSTASLSELGKAELSWRAAIQGLLANTGLDAVPDQGALTTAARQDSEVGSLAIRQAVLSAALAGETERVERLATLAASLPRGPLASTVASLSRAWAAVSRDEPPPEPAAPTSRDLLDPSLVVEATALKALASLRGGAPGEALATARRASRMAASDGVLQGEYFANLVLARVRRHAGQSALSLRILQSLRSVTPAVWHPWIELEEGLSGSLASDRWTKLRSALKAGDAAALRQASEDLVQGALPFLRTELRGWVAMTDVRERSTPEVERWLSGQDTTPPFGVHDSEPTSLTHGFVFCSGAKVRRVLAHGVPATPATPLEGNVKMRRTFEALAHLAFAGQEGLATAALFEAVYRFQMTELNHQELLRGLLHRARKAIEGKGVIARDGDRLRLTASEAPLLFPDPRCELSLGDQILRHLAAGEGHGTARGIASALRVPLRTVQRTLGGLVEEGACDAQTEGRSVRYVVEDTTFHQPTLQRLRGQR